MVLGLNGSGGGGGRKLVEGEIMVNASCGRMIVMV